MDRATMETLVAREETDAVDARGWKGRPAAFFMQALGRRAAPLVELTVPYNEAYVRPLLGPGDNNTRLVPSAILRLVPAEDTNDYLIQGPSIPESLTVDLGDAFLYTQYAPPPKGGDTLLESVWKAIATGCRGRLSLTFSGSGLKERHVARLQNRNKPDAIGVRVLERCVAI